MPGCQRQAVSGSVIQQPAVSQNKLTWKLVAPILTVAAIILFLAGWFFRPQPEPTPKPLMKFTYHLPEGNKFSFADNQLAISPDGTKIVYVAESDGVRQLFLRKIDEYRTTLLEDTKRV